jgi:hypothetical protein
MQTMMLQYTYSEVEPHHPTCDLGIPVQNAPPPLIIDYIDISSYCAAMPSCIASHVILVHRSVQGHGVNV